MNKTITITLLTLCLFVTNPLSAADEHDHTEEEASHSGESEHEDQRKDEHGDEHGEESGSIKLTAADEHNHTEEEATHAGESENEDQRKDEHDDEHGEESGSIKLTAEQRDSAGIVVETLTMQPITTEFEAPGEIRLNSYATHQLTPRIEAQVISRHARLGEIVSKGQPLVTLSSVTMAEAQGALLIADNEWKRVTKLGRKVVSERRYQDARIAVQQARVRLLAYGMTQTQIEGLLSSNKMDQADGRFALLAPITGTVITDDFVTGQMVQAGDLLFEISDESRLWIEARLDPDSASHIEMGNPAQVLAAGHWVTGRVIQIHHALDESTRTLGVRLEIPNPDDRLHPGQFVTARIQTAETEGNGMVLPLDAVLRSADGDWQVFVEHEPGEFEPKEVEVIRQLAGQIQVEGLEVGTRVVTQGAFFVQSEMAKSGFDVHNH